MKLRQIIIIGVAIVIVAICFAISSYIGKGKEKPTRKQVDNVATVFTTTVQNDSISIEVQSTGVLEAVRRMELFAEVQGQMLPDNGRFKAGNTFRKGELLVGIQANDQQAQLFAQRSNFESSLTAVMADLRSDYSAEFPKWEKYLNSYATNQNIKELPEVESEKLKSFLVGRGIYSSYHSLKNMEILYGKYRIVAPYDGVLIEANADPGTVIRQGQALGTFIQPERYEMETSVDALTAENLSVGQKVNLHLQGNAERKWEGTISRVVRAVDRSSQMSAFFVEVMGSDLKEGMFLTANIEAGKIPNAFQFNRSALVDNNQVYVVQADTLALKQVQVESIGENEVVVSGLNNGEQMLSKVPTTAFEGMKVSIYKEKK